ncbi:MAG: RNA-binding protein [Phycisphaerales bacterium]|nr:RNA-binding protein [Phycisphaerales bacterium]
MSSPVEVTLNEGSEHIALCDLLKHAGLSESGGAAKMLIAEGAVRVDGVTETRKRCKIRPGQVVETGGQTVKVIGPAISPG